jgi:hypothetical protein
VGVRDGADDVLADGDGPSESVGSGVVDGARVSESAGSAVIDGVNVRALVGLGIGVDGAAQDARKSASAVKAISFLIPLPLLYLDRSVAFWP